MDSVRDWARRYRDRGWGITHLRKGEKVPMRRGWTRRSEEPDIFEDGLNIGILYGALSGDLVCVDIDDHEALKNADLFLPPTGLIEGRPGKPRSHRLYRVADIPPEHTATCAGGIGGPRIRRFFHGETDKAVVEIIGTGGQAVAPPSVNVTKGREKRRWDEFGDPAVVACGELYEAVARLAKAHGWRAKSPRRPRKAAECGPPPPMPAHEKARKARNYLDRVPGAVVGGGSNNRLYAVACLLVRNFDLSPEEALPILLEYDQLTTPAPHRAAGAWRWTTEELREKLAAADDFTGARGDFLPASTRRIAIHIGPGDDDILVGIDCATSGQSYVDLHPTIWSGIVGLRGVRYLAPELDAIDWAGRCVTIVPASNIHTNSREVWGEFFLGRFLRERGAHVRSLYLPPSLRRTTYGRVADQGLTLGFPPLFAHEAKAKAELASQRAKELAPARSRAPRKKGPRRKRKLDRAVEYLRERGGLVLESADLEWGKENGIGERTMWSALRVARCGPAVCGSSSS